MIRLGQTLTTIIRCALHPAFLPWAHAMHWRGGHANRYSIYMNEKRRNVRRRCDRADDGSIDRRHRIRARAARRAARDESRRVARRQLRGMVRCSVAAWRATLRSHRAARVRCRLCGVLRPLARHGSSARRGDRRHARSTRDGCRSRRSDPAERDVDTEHGAAAAKVFRCGVALERIQVRGMARFPHFMHAKLVIVDGGRPFFSARPS